MRQWTAQRKHLPRFAENTEVVSFIYQTPDGLCREDKLTEGLNIPADLPQGTLGWWRWRVTKRPPTQKELNERLEQLFTSLKESAAPHKHALVWLVGLYLTRKKILRQEPGAFVHAKSGERTEVNPEEIDATKMEAAMQELMAVIS